MLPEFSVPDVAVARFEASSVTVPPLVGRTRRPRACGYAPCRAPRGRVRHRARGAGGEQVIEPAVQIAVRRAVHRVGRERARAVAQRQRAARRAFPLHVRHEQAAGAARPSAARSASCRWRRRTHCRCARTSAAGSARGRRAERCRRGIDLVGHTPPVATRSPAVRLTPECAEIASASVGRGAVVQVRRALPCAAQRRACRGRSTARRGAGRSSAFDGADVDSVLRCAVRERRAAMARGAAACAENRPARDSSPA